MANNNSYQLSTGAAETYEAQKVPAIFAPVARATLDAIRLPAGAEVLDVACGTGIVARAVAERLTKPSRITGADLNPAMIEVARRQPNNGPHQFDYVVAPAEDMPFAAGRFDLVFCQQGLQFFPDKPAALSEMRRVTSDRGALVLTCWAGAPALFQAIAAVLQRDVTPEAAAIAIAPFAFSDAALTLGLIEAAGYRAAAPVELEVVRDLPATRDAIRHELLASPNEAALRALGEPAIDRIADEVLDALVPFATGDRLNLPQRARLFQARAR